MVGMRFLLLSSMLLAGCSSNGETKIVYIHDDAATDSAQDAPLEASKDSEAQPDAEEPDGQDAPAIDAHEPCALSCFSLNAECGFAPAQLSFCPAGKCCGVCPSGKWCSAGNVCQDACPAWDPNAGQQGVCVMMVDGKHACQIPDGGVPSCPWDSVWNCYDCTTATGC